MKDLKTPLALALAGLLPLAGCALAGKAEPGVRIQASATQKERADLVDLQIAKRGIYSPELLQALKEVPREPYVEAAYQDQANHNIALPMARAQGRLLASPYRTAEILQALELDPTLKVLEIGAGSGYRAALLSHLVGDVYALEEDGSLATDMQFRLSDGGQAPVRVRQGSPEAGWPDAAPFDRILVSLENLANFEALLDQLADGGLLIAPDPNLNHLHVCKRLSQNNIQRERIPLRSERPLQP